MMENVDFQFSIIEKKTRTHTHMEKLFENYYVSYTMKLISHPDHDHGDDNRRPIIFFFFFYQKKKKDKMNILVFDIGFCNGNIDGSENENRIESNPISNEFDDDDGKSNEKEIEEVVVNIGFLYIYSFSYMILCILLM